jgi:hypothetical protein
MSWLKGPCFMQLSCLTPGAHDGNAALGIAAISSCALRTHHSEALYGNPATGR